MRLLFIILLCLTELLAKGNIYLGAGPYIQTQPYKGLSSKLYASPVIFFDNKTFYIRWSEVGVYIAGAVKDNYSWGLSIAAQPLAYGYKANNSSELKGMSNKNSSIEGGLELDIKYNKLLFSITAFHDLLNNNNSYDGHFQIGTSLHVKKITFYPSVLLIYNANKFNNYYYGVTKREATSWRPYYNAHGGFNYACETYINYPITKKLQILSNLEIQYLNTNITNSPIVNNKYIYSALLSLIYKVSF